MNEHFYMPLPVAALEIGRTRPSREVRRRKTKKPYGSKAQLPKRRKFHKGGHNKDRHHK